MTNDKKLMLLAGVLALGMLAGCSSASVDAVPVETNGAIEVGKAVSEDKDNWTPYNTTVFTKDGVVSNILRIWVP